MNELVTTILQRPYVFVFLAAYLFLAVRKWGIKRTLIWLVSGYFIAWVSEYSSIHNGFPYGEYHYIYENLKGELLVAGVPFFDSLSYPFLIFAGYTTAEYMLGDTGHGTRDRISGHRSPIPYPGIFLGALLTMLLDVIIDPIATMGDKWFLGLIHYYAHPGYYFGVPMTNFAGWFLVAFAVIAFNVLIWKVLDLTISRSHDLTNFIFYFSIALFNIVISFWVGEWKLGFCSSAICLVIVGFLLLFRIYSRAT